jgi:hypothetical protein
MLSPGEATKGMAITIHSLKEEGYHPASGVPFTILGVSLPYIMAKAFGAEKPIIMDTRYINLMELSPGYVAAAKTIGDNGPTLPPVPEMAGIPSSILELFERMNDSPKKPKRKKK